MRSGSYWTPDGEGVVLALLDGASVLMGEVLLLHHVVSQCIKVAVKAFLPLEVCYMRLVFKIKSQFTTLTLKTRVHFSNRVI